MTKERRYILIGGLVLLLFGAAYRFFPDIQAFFSFEDELAQKEKNLVKYHRMIQEKNRLEANLSMMEEQLQTAEEGLLSGETTAIAAVDIQNTMDEITGMNEIDIRSMQVMKPEGQKEHPYLSVPVQVSLETNSRGLKKVLYAIETSAKTLRVGDLRIGRIRRGDPDRIQATFTVTGYMKKR